MDLTLITSKGEVTLIDCSDGADITEGMEWLKKIKCHQRHGRLLWDGTNLEELRSWRQPQHIFVPWNVCVLYWLLGNRGQIPLWLKGKYLVFRGTCFLNQDGEGVLLSLFWNKYQEDWAILPYPENWIEETRRSSRNKPVKPVRLVYSSGGCNETGGQRARKSERPELRVVKS